MSSCSDWVLSFRDLTVTNITSNDILLHHLSGYVRRSGITAVIGQGGSGKSLLLRVLSGREPLLQVSGTAICLNQIISFQRRSAINFVGQEDVNLIGTMTVREIITFNARLGSATNKKKEEIDTIVNNIITGLGLSHVADKLIGGVLKRGLSGGEKRRVSVAAVLASQPAVICLDEPTSGLDAAVAYSVIQSIKSIAIANNVGILLSIHQPSSRILSLFDELIILDRGYTIYSGPTSMAVDHFEHLGYPCPDDSTATDHFLDVLRRTPKPETFIEAFKTSNINKSIEQQLILNNNSVSSSNSTFSISRAIPAGSVPLFRQIFLLAHRSSIIAFRDLTLYWLQIVLAAGFAFLTGAVFWSLPRVIGPRMQDQGNSIVWLTFIASYLQVFKVYYLFSMKNRFHDETANGLYSSLAWSVSDFITTSFFSFLIYTPTLLIGYGMMGLPIDSIGYVIFALFLTTMTAESLLDWLCQLSSYLPTAILLGQGTLVILCVYAGGAFIRWASLGFWIWLSDISLYTYSTRGMMIKVSRSLEYYCSSDMVQGDSCLYDAVSYPCQADSVQSDGSCYISGSDVLRLYNEVSETDEWFQLAMLVVLLVSFRLLTHIFLTLPVTHWITRFKSILINYCFHYHNSNPSHNNINNNVLSTAVSNDRLHDGVAIHDRQLSSMAVPSHASPPLVFKDVCLFLANRNGKMLVDHVSGQAYPGRVLAILGPSGAGKTTFLNAISGRAPYAYVSGSVTIGNEPFSIRHLSYVPQFDCLNPALTVYQTFCSTAFLQQKNIQDCTQLVAQLLEVLDLLSVAKHAVRSLSSGLRKRIAIGLGLLAQPAVLLLDEPTTGLDSTTSAMIVEYIVRVTRKTGIICCMTIHQPSVQLFRQFDDLLLLSKGHMAYFGQVNQATTYFHRLAFDCPPASNCADYFLDLMNATQEELETMRNNNNKQNEVAEAVVADIEDSKQTGQLLSKDLSWAEEFSEATKELNSYAFHSSSVLNNNDIPNSAAQHPKEEYRLYTLTMLRLLYFYQERTIYVYRLLLLIIVAIFIGTLFLRLSLNTKSIIEIGGALFFKVWVILFIAISATPIMVNDRLTFENEYLNQTYAATTYCLANLIASLPYQFISSIIYEAIVWYLVGFNDDGSHYLFSVLSTFSLLLMMESISLITVQILKDAMLSTTFSMVVLGTLFLFPGFFVSTANMVAPIRWLSYVVPTHYDLTSQLVNVFEGQNYGISGTDNGMSGSTILSLYYSVTDSYSKWINWLIVMIYMLGFRLIHYLLIRFQYRNYGHSKIERK